MIRSLQLKHLLILAVIMLHFGCASKTEDQRVTERIMSLSIAEIKNGPPSAIYLGVLPGRYNEGEMRDGIVSFINHYAEENGWMDIGAEWGPLVHQRGYYSVIKFDGLNFIAVLVGADQCVFAVRWGPRFS